MVQEAGVEEEGSREQGSGISTLANQNAYNICELQITKCQCEIRR